MDQVLEGLSWEICLCYLDDIVVFSATWNDHLARLRRVFERLREAGLKLKPSKCSLARRETTFLGHVISAEGLRADPRNLAAIHQVPTSTTVKEVQLFLGMAPYYRRFIKNFSDRAAPMFALTRKDVAWLWTKECGTALRDLKAALTNPPVTAFPNFALPFHLYTDASDLGLGAVLAQVQNNRERAIAYESRTLNASEKRHSATKKECLAVVWALKKFRPYLLCNHFHVLTDHHSLQWLRSMKSEDCLLHTWACSLEEYDFQIKHRPGKSQALVDGLLRLPQVPLLMISLPHEVKEEMKATAATVEQGQPPSPGLRLTGGYLFHRLGRLALGPKGAQHAMSLLHRAAGGHLGIRKTLAKFRQRFYAPQDTLQVRNTVTRCKGCQLGTDYRKRPVPPGSIEALKPWDILAVDIMGPYPPHRAKRFIITFIDCLSLHHIGTCQRPHRINGGPSPHGSSHLNVRGASENPIRPRV